MSWSGWKQFGGHLKYFNSRVISALVLCLMFCWYAAVTVKFTLKDDKVVYQSSFCKCNRSFAGKISDEVIHWCSEESTFRGYNQNIVAYSLYGDSIKNNQTTRYYVILDLIPKQVKMFFPDWRIRIYHGLRDNQNREREILCRVYCENDNVDLCDVNKMISSFSSISNKSKSSIPVLGEELAKLNRMNWRYLPMIDPRVDRMMAKDTDSEVNDREFAAVNQWLRSDYTFHVMRDHPGHHFPIMGGIFGVKVYKERYLIQGLIRAMIQLGTSEGYGLDQTLLTKLFWPVVKDDAVIHDSYYCERRWNSLPITPYPTQRDPVKQLFVTERVGGPAPKPGVCPAACRPPDHQDWKFC